MDKKGIKLLAIDLDGTLLRDDKTVDPEDLEALRECLDRGIEVVIASGRFPSSHRRITKDLGLGLEGSIQIADGGGTVYEGRSERMIGQMTDSQYQEVLEKIREAGLQTYVTDGHKVYYEKSGPLDELYRPLKESGEGRIERVEDLSKLKNVLKFIIYCESQEELENISELEAPGTKSFMAAQKIAEVTSEDLDKWSALESVMERMGIGPESVACIGDSGNDLEMVRNAGLGLAVGNAISEVREAADHVSESDNNHRAVKELIEQYILH